MFGLNRFSPFKGHPVVTQAHHGLHNGLDMTAPIGRPVLGYLLDIPEGSPGSVWISALKMCLCDRMTWLMTWLNDVLHARNGATEHQRCFFWFPNAMCRFGGVPLIQLWWMQCWQRRLVCYCRSFPGPFASSFCWQMDVNGLGIEVWVHGTCRQGRIGNSVQSGHWRRSHSASASIQKQLVQCNMQWIPMTYNDVCRCLHQEWYGVMHCLVLRVSHFWPRPGAASLPLPCRLSTPARLPETDVRRLQHASYHDVSWFWYDMYDDIWSIVYFLLSLA